MGTITPVTTYSGVDLVASEGVAVGKQIGAAGLQSVAANSNYCGMQYSGPLASFSWSPTAPGFDTNEDMVELYVPADIDRRDLWLVIFAQSKTVLSGSTASATLTAKVAGGSSLNTWSIAYEAAAACYDCSVSSPSASAWTLSIQLDKKHAQITGGILFRKMTKSGDTVDDTPRASGFRFATAAELAATEPLTDEMVNRLVTNPQKLYDATPLSHCSILPAIRTNTMAQNVAALGGGSATGAIGLSWLDETGMHSWAVNDFRKFSFSGGTSRKLDGPHGPIGAWADGSHREVCAFIFAPRYDQTVTVASHFIAPTGSTLRIELTEGVKVTMPISSTTFPAVGAAPTWRTATADVLGGKIYAARVYFDGTHSEDWDDWGFLLGLQVFNG